MKGSRKNIIFCLFILVVLSSCAVVKKPYLTSAYYTETMTELDRRIVSINEVTDSLYAGFSRVSLTPDMSETRIPIAGFGQMKTKFADGIHDSLFVRAVALKSGNTFIIMMSADMLLIPPNITKSLVESLAAEGISRKQLFLMASHSHSGIGGWGYGVLAKLIAGKRDKELESWITDRMKTAILGAVKDMKPASLGTGSFSAPQYTRNRLTGDEKRNNDDFNFVVLEQLNGREGIIGTFSAHATTIGSKNTLLSADYPGAWASKLEGKAAYLAMFCGGSMGSQSPSGEGSGFELAEFIGRGLADSTLKHTKEMKMSRVVKLSPLSLPIELPSYHFRMSKNLNFSTFASRWLMARPTDVYLQALMLNDLLWFTVPGDFSGESALMIKNILRGKGYEAVVSGYNGSYVGYIMPGKYFYLKNYETKDMGWFGPAMGDYITDMLLRMADSLIEKR